MKGRLVGAGLAVALGLGAVPACSSERPKPVTDCFAINLDSAVWGSTTPWPSNLQTTTSSIANKLRVDEKRVQQGRRGPAVCEGEFTLAEVSGGQVVRVSPTATETLAGLGDLCVAFALVVGSTLPKPDQTRPTVLAACPTQQ